MTIEDTQLPDNKPGLIVLLGSGETLPSSGKVHEYVARRLPDQPSIVILETPAGFEPNSAAVAGKIKTYLERRLQNYNPRIEVIPARKRGTEMGTDNPDIVAPILEADEILLGPGSPTYAARNLRGTLAAEMIAVRHQLGATVFLSSSATLSFGRYTMPVYEIYKVGEDLHWKQGVDFFSRYGLSLVIVPHWDNSDGGSDLDTSHCYMGAERFSKLAALLQRGQLVIGIDEHTGLIIEPAEQRCLVRGLGGVTLLRDGVEERFSADSSFPLAKLGTWQTPPPGAGVSPDVWERAIAAQRWRQTQRTSKPEPDEQVNDLVAQRDAARAQRDWSKADALRDQLAALGWQVRDTDAGSVLEPLPSDAGEPI